MPTARAKEFRCKLDSFQISEEVLCNHEKEFIFKNIYCIIIWQYINVVRCLIISYLSRVYEVELSSSLGQRAFSNEMQLVCKNLDPPVTTSMPKRFQDVSHQSCDCCLVNNSFANFFGVKIRFLPASWGVCRYTEEQSMCAGFGGLEHVHRSAHSCWTFSCAVRFREVRSLWLAFIQKITTISGPICIWILAKNESRVMIRFDVRFLYDVRWWKKLGLYGDHSAEGFIDSLRIHLFP